jgi:DNA-binding XRE family transcriptional regulator
MIFRHHMSDYHTRGVAAMDAGRFSTWRKRLGWTQEEAADQLGRTRQTINAWESGKQSIPEEIESVCQWKEREWLQRPEFGPVHLAWCDASLFPDRNPGRRFAHIQLQEFMNNAKMLDYVKRHIGNDSFHDPFVLWFKEEEGADGAPTGVFDTTELMSAVAKRSP